MTVNIALATVDGGVYRQKSTYASAITGPGEFVTNTSVMTFGQNFSGALYVIDQSFVEFPYTRDTNQVLDSAYFEVTCAIQYGAGTTRQLEVSEFAFGASVDVSDWRTPSQLAALTDLAICPGINGASSEQKVRLSGAGLRARLQSSGPIRTVWYTDKNRLSTAPTGDNRTSVYATEQGGTSKDPVLVWTTLRVSTMARVGGAACQLSDGTNVVLENTTAETTLSGNNIKLRRVANGTATATDIATLTTAASGAGAFGRVVGGFQSFAVCRDSSDNIFVFGRSANAVTTIAMQAFLKGAGLTWTAQPIRDVAVGIYDSSLENFVAAWHSVGGADGTIILIYSAAPATPERSNAASTNQLACAFVNPGYIKTGTGSGTRNVISAPSFLLVFGNGFSGYHNETLTGLDVVAAPGAPDKGLIISYNNDDGFSYDDPAVTRYLINPSGNGFTSVNDQEVDLTEVTRDANSKLRTLGISDLMYAVAGGERPFEVFQATGSSWTDLASVHISELTGASGLPASLNGITTWDVVHDVGGNKLWLYYIDKLNARRLCRTGFDLSTMLPMNTEIQVNAAIGASGASTHAIRAPRGALVGSQLVITAASQATGGGAYSTVYVADTFNLAPNAPTLTPKANYDATASGTFTWTINDPNPGDTQTAYEINIINAATASTVVSSGKVVSAVSQHVVNAGTLANGNTYQWKVRTWDSGDLVGAFSSLSNFSTGAGGNVTITNPATDNPATAISDEYAIQWSASGTTQASYRVRIVRTSDSVQISDTGFLASVATEHLITGLLSGVEYRIEVSVRNAALVVSTVGTRLITPQYGAPEIPQVDVTPLPELGYIEVTVDNPIPGAPDLGTSPDDFETVGASANYAASNGVLTTGDTSQFSSGSAAAKFVVSASGAQAYFRQQPAFKVEVTPGQRYTAIFDLLSLDGASSVNAAIDWQDASAVYLSTTSLGASAAAGGWVTRQVTGTAPALAASASFGPTLPVATAVAGKTIYVDNLILVASNDRPAVLIDEIYRREVGVETDFRLIATLDPDPVFRDYYVRPGRQYEYKVKALASSASIESETDLATLDLIGTGIWLLDPADPDDTNVNFRYGEGKSEDVDTLGEGAYYVGREAPVFDYGEYLAESVRVSVQVPFGDTWRDQLDTLDEFARLKKTVLYRDGRGRKVYGQLTDMATSDERWGSLVGFTVTRSDYTEQVFS